MEKYKTKDCQGNVISVGDIVKCVDFTDSGGGLSRYNSQNLFLVNYSSNRTIGISDFPDILVGYYHSNRFFLISRSN
jgi:hypothetical protein